jgi:hypothetical protein
MDKCFIFLVRFASLRASLRRKEEHAFLSAPSTVENPP